MKIKFQRHSIFLLLIIILSGIYLLITDAAHSGDKLNEDSGKNITIFPDYSNTVIPPNIAPLNVVIHESAPKYRVIIESETGEKIEISSQHPKINIPVKKWRKLLQANRGNELRFKIAVFMNNSWNELQPIKNRIAPEEIDSHLAYRLINPAYVWWRQMGIFQRNLESFEEKPILLNRATDGSCMNCHNFSGNDPDKMMIHLRATAASGTVIARDGELIKANTGTKLTKAGAYPSWHPNGKMIAYSVNQLEMFFHAAGEPRDVLDRGSDLIVYNIDENMVTTHPSISSPERMETFPNWSPDGKYLYFCSSPKFELFIDGSQYDHEQIKYDLMRIGYDSETGAWGELETVIAASEIGLSMTIPKISPDGRFLLFCTARCGNFPIYMPDADIWMLNLETGNYQRLAINSEQGDTYHSWSSNSRWFVFSSKRDDGVCARPYFAYVDETGKVYKPFVLPQEDPEYYDTYLKTFNVPELITGPVTIRPQTIVMTAFDNANKKNAVLDPAVTHLGRQQAEEKMWQPAPKK